MRDFLITNIQIILWCISFIEIIFICLYIREYFKEKKIITLCMLAVAIGLLVDVTIVAAGGVIENLPFFLSRLRFVFHGLLSPLVLLICGFGLRFRKKAIRVLMVVTVLLMIAGVIQAFNVDLEKVTVGANIRYASSKLTPGWVNVISQLLSFGTIIPLIISGLITWIKFKTPHMFFAGFLMFIFAGIGPATGNMDLLFLITMFGEVAMLVSYYLYLRTERVPS